MTDAAPGFAADILPKFRPGDISCMARRGVKLSDAAWMRDPAGGDGHADHAHARNVFDQLSQGLMPPDNPWPDGWVATYRNWMGGGFAP
jgi:hypothetical protein